jgi:hypothetical protein
MNRDKLILFACPALLASMLLVANPLHAAEVVAQPKETVESTPAKPIFEVVFEQETPESPMDTNAAIDRSGCNCSSESPMLEFTDEESNAARARYGCDCSGCLNAVRQLQGKLPLL